MPHPHLIATEGIVLRHIDLGEADRILTIFTPQLGKVRAVAKGARKVTSKLAGVSDMLTRSQLLLAAGRELDIVTQGELRERFEHLRQSLWHATAGYAIAEALDRALEDRDPHPDIYRLGLESLQRLDADALAWLADPAPASQAGPEARGWAAMRYFELVLLEALGYRPNFTTCISCDTPLEPVEDNGFNPEQGGALCPQCLRLSQRRLPLLTLKVLRLVQRTEWQALPVMRLDARTREDVESVTRSLLTLALDRSLRAWGLMQHGQMP
jgi:DNA repair protein RecO (recombination protein O)